MTTNKRKVFNAETKIKIMTLTERGLFEYLFSPHINFAPYCAS
jgi:hypothetical protein